MTPGVVVLLNEASHHGAGRRRWARVRELVEERHRIEVVTVNATGSHEASLARAYDRGKRRFIAAGGDGTVNALVDALRRHAGDAAVGAVTLGAVGLGSSNDFHKPRPAGEHGIAVRIDFERTLPREIVSMTYVDSNDRTRERCFLVSASVGIVAHANALYNGARGAIGIAKSCSTELAMALAALGGVLGHRTRRMTLYVDERTFEADVNNLSLLKTPHLAGGLRYDGDLARTDGRIALHLAFGMSRRELAATLIGLCRGRFVGRPNTFSTSAACVGIQAARPFSVEIDGELVAAQRATFSVLPRRIQVCS